MRPRRGRPHSCDGSGHTRRDTRTRSLPPSGWGAPGRGGSAERPRRRQPRPGTPGRATVTTFYRLFWGGVFGLMERRPRFKVHQIAEALTTSAGPRSTAARALEPDSRTVAN